MKNHFDVTTFDRALSNGDLNAMDAGELREHLAHYRARRLALGAKRTYMNEYECGVARLIASQIDEPYVAVVATMHEDAELIGYDR